MHTQTGKNITARPVHPSRAHRWLPGATSDRATHHQGDAMQVPRATMHNLLTARGNTGSGKSGELVHLRLEETLSTSSANSSQLLVKLTADVFVLARSAGGTHSPARWLRSCAKAGGALEGPPHTGLLQSKNLLTQQSMSALLYGRSKSHPFLT